MSWADLAGAGITVRDSPYETRRFGLSFERIVIGNATSTEDLEELPNIVDSLQAEIVVLRYPSRVLVVPSLLLQSRRKILPADTLTYWEKDIRDAVVQPPAPPLSIAAEEGVSEKGMAALATVVRDSFAGYGNHYGANPALDQDLALEGYLEWAQRAYSSHPRNVVFLLHDGNPVGVATLTESTGEIEIELAGLVGKAQGQGWYGSLLDGVVAEAKERGADRVIISTQAANIRVQRAWVRAGFKPFGCFNTCHLVRWP